MCIWWVSSMCAHFRRLEIARARSSLLTFGTGGSAAAACCGGGALPTVGQNAHAARCPSVPAAGLLWRYLIGRRQERVQAGERGRLGRSSAATGKQQRDARLACALAAPTPSAQRAGFRPSLARWSTPCQVVGGRALPRPLRTARAGRFALATTRLPARVTPPLSLQQVNPRGAPKRAGTQQCTLMVRVVERALGARIACRSSCSHAAAWSLPKCASPRRMRAVCHCRGRRHVKRHRALAATGTRAARPGSVGLRF